MIVRWPVIVRWLAVELVPMLCGELQCGEGYKATWRV